VVAFNLPPAFKILTNMKYLISLITLLILLVGCSHNHEALSENISSVDAKVVSLQDSISALNQTINNISEERIVPLEKDIIYLENKIDLLEETLSFYTDRFESIYDMINYNNQGKGLTPITKVSNSSSPITTKVTGNKQPQELYNQAREYYAKRQLTKAKAGFTEMINKYPNHELVINCKYWLAEIDYDQEKYSEAIEKFQQISLNSVNPEKALDSLFKIAFINKKLGNYDLALSQAKAIKGNSPNYIRINKINAFIKGLE
jgi:TolA-binding protein